MMLHTHPVPIRFITSGNYKLHRRIPRNPLRAGEKRFSRITTDGNICGGRPVVSGTRFTVQSIVYYILNQGMTPEELSRDFPHLSLPAIYDALSYYYDNKAEIDRDIAMDEAGPTDAS